MGQQTKRLGAHGEALARQAYERAGYAVLAQNWHCREPRGELDLVLARGTCVVICEVKTRTSQRYGTPAEAVDWRKQIRLRKLAGRFLRERSVRGAPTVRFDVASVIDERVEIIENAF